MTTNHTPLNELSEKKTGRCLMLSPEQIEILIHSLGIAQLSYEELHRDAMKLYRRNPQAKDNNKEAEYLWRQSCLFHDLYYKIKNGGLTYDRKATAPDHGT